MGNPYESSPATALWEGAVAMRRSLFDAVGGWPDEFFYAHEGIDLVWRVWDEGYTPWYAADLVAHHPVIDPARHDVYYRLNARNRVWLARRNLPVVLEPVYVGTWVGMTLLRVHDREALGAWFAGLQRGYRPAPGGAAPDEVGHGVGDDEGRPAARHLRAAGSSALGVDAVCAHTGGRGPQRAGVERRGRCCGNRR